MAEAYLFDKITIIGLGLIGSSIARAARTHHLAHTITGCDQNEIALTYARSQNIIDATMHDATTAVKDSQLVILATPPSAFANITKTMASALATGTIVMDIASVKEAAIQAIAPNLPAHVEFIPAHPIAGSEQSGIRAGRDDLFNRKHIIITPEAAALTPALQKITSFWQAMGARVDAMPAELHDQIYAYVSHLPQLLAFACHSVLDDRIDAANESEMLRRFLRISHSNPVLWSEIFVLNKNNIIKALDRYLDVISHIKHELMHAPEGQKSIDDQLTYTTLFPRIAASCLITTVMEAERPVGVPFVRFAGTGFEDFTFPASLPPENDIEQISQNYAAIHKTLENFAAKLHAIRSAISDGDKEKLQEALVS